MPVCMKVWSWGCSIIDAIYSMCHPSSSSASLCIQFSLLYSHDMPMVLWQYGMHNANLFPSVCYKRKMKMLCGRRKKPNSLYPTYTSISLNCTRITRVLYDREKTIFPSHIRVRVRCVLRDVCSNLLIFGPAARQYAETGTARPDRRMTSLAKCTRVHPFVRCACRPPFPERHRRSGNVRRLCVRCVCVCVQAHIRERSPLIRWMRGTSLSMWNRREDAFNKSTWMSLWHECKLNVTPRGIKCMHVLQQFAWHRELVVNIRGESRKCCYLDMFSIFRLDWQCQISIW